MPGESFLGEITGGRKGQNREIVVFDEYGPVRMIRNDRYKYVHRYNTGLHEFYDLKDDPDEKINRISEKEYRVLIEQMREKLFQWFALYSDPDRDGSKEPVAGNGQLCRCGAYAESEPAFDTNRKATSSSNAGYGQ